MSNIFKVFFSKPDDFLAKVEVVALYFEYNDKLLLLKRAKNKPYGNTWGAPAGKLEKSESAKTAIIREVFEETNISVKQEELIFLDTLYIRKPEIDFTYHMFHKKCPERPSITLNDEHQEYRWVEIEKALQMNLILAGKETIYHYQKMKK